MRRTVFLLLAIQQICFFGGLAVCVALRPAGLGANGGMSYYGIFPNTFPYYALSFLGTSITSLLAARFISTRELRPLRYGLLAFGILIIIITFTDYSWSAFFDWSHTIAGVILFIVQFAVSFWILARLKWARWPLFFLFLEAVAGGVSIVYVLPSHGFLIQGQAAFQLAFAGLLFFGFRGLLPTPERLLRPTGL